MAKPTLNRWITGINKPVEAFASVADFGRVFSFNMNRLYLLAYLLTGDHETAERCFVEGIDHCINRNSVFKERAPSWARRAIIKAAILMVAPEFEGCGERPNRNRLPVVCRQVSAALLDNVAQLEPFERCVFVMTSLEQISDHECSLLLRSTRSEVIRARRGAMGHLSSRSGLATDSMEMMA